MGRNRVEFCGKGWFRMLKSAVRTVQEDEADHKGRVLEEWNSRSSSWRSVCPRSPWVDWLGETFKE